MHYQKGIEVLITELRIQTQDFESQNKDYIGEIIKELQISTGIPEERKKIYDYEMSTISQRPARNAENTLRKSEDL